MHSYNKGALQAATLAGLVLIGWSIFTGTLSGILIGVAVLVGGLIILRVFG